MDIVTRFQCYRIRRQLGQTMREARAARQRVEKMAKKMEQLMIVHGTTPEDVKFANLLFENCNRLADVVDTLRPYAPPPTFLEAIEDIKEMAKVEQILMAKRGGTAEDLSAKG